MGHSNLKEHFRTFIPWLLHLRLHNPSTVQIPKSKGKFPIPLSLNQPRETSISALLLKVILHKSKSKVIIWTKEEFHLATTRVLSSSKWWWWCSSYRNPKFKTPMVQGSNRTTLLLPVSIWVLVHHIIIEVRVPPHPQLLDPQMLLTMEAY